MTSLQVAQNRIKDLKIVISNLRTKYSGYEELQQTVTMLQRGIQCLTKENEQLKNKIENLTDQLETLRNHFKKTSETSDKPSSASIFKKPISTRVKSGKKPGGQPGHKGHTLQPFPDPEVIDCPPVERCGCGGRVSVKKNYKSKQLVDIQLVLKVKEEHVRVGYCEKCRKKHEGTFSEKYVNPVNYGDDIKAMVSVLNTRMNLPVNKISELISILTDSRIQISDGTIVNIVADLAKKSDSTVKCIVEHLTKCGLILTDETGCRVNGKLDWFQIFTNDPFILFSHNKKRGSLLFEDEDLLALFSGILLHDHFKPYYRYNNLSHAECNEHIDRRLKAVNEILKHEWALELRSFFFDADKRKKELMTKGEYFNDEQIKGYFNRFLEILDKGDAEYQQAIKGKKRIAQYNDEKCLLKRLRKYAPEHLKFISIPEVPRGNNAAERGAKEAKRKVRVSGGFRSDIGADNYARITSVVSTMSKHKMDVFKGIKDIMNGNTLNFKSLTLDSG